MKKKWMVAPVLILAAACGGGGGGGAATPTTVTTPAPPRDGVVVLDGSIGGRFTLSSSPARLSRTLFGCGDAAVTIPYRETRGGRATAADFEVKLLEFNDDFARRVTGRAMNITIDPNESGTITITERFVCIEYTTAIPPRADVALNFGGAASGLVSQIRGVGPLVVIE